jgi:hypothetical protein
VQDRPSRKTKPKAKRRLVNEFASLIPIKFQAQLYYPAMKKKTKPKPKPKNSKNQILVQSETRHPKSSSEVRYLKEQYHILYFDHERT